MDHLQEKNVLDIQLSEESKMTLTGVAQWMNINAIVGFISLALSLISTMMTVGKASRLGSDGGGSQIFTMLITIGISLLLNITLLSAAKNLKNGIATADGGMFRLGMRKFASYFRILGIILIVALVIITLVVIIAVIYASSRGFR